MPLLCLLATSADGQVSWTGDHISMPLRHIALTSTFGYRKHPVTGLWKFHSGTDLAARRDTVYSILDGIVIRSGYDPYMGLGITIGHGADIQTIYGHLSMFYVMPGDTVSASQPIGLTGSTGMVTGEHLHFAVRYAGQYLHPLRFLKGLFERPPPRANDSSGRISKTRFLTKTKNDDK
ncbi:M23 family metallopeptidase [Pedobacter sp. ISL-64]|uniref:M23 family metallopeptidase n=1 Tax=Pedobacter sp. ISL-64 TaxID=2819164 RepID=UPI001BE52105|nr:M23 family metallopeptidase [Pedobacter sp. ISL-64]MBT2560136.1 M23 family metallopeptidase [Pedobacter sp. ISL-64]